MLDRGVVLSVAVINDIKHYIHRIFKYRVKWNSRVYYPRSTSLNTASDAFNAPVIIKQINGESAYIICQSISIHTPAREK